jgi:4-amino-4-deoxy-L-arabinose transferase-like glycosyltransferase
MSYSWETHSAASETASVAPVATAVGTAWPARARASALTMRRWRPELFALVGLAGVLNLWALAKNGWANDYYSAAVRSMSSSWHNFLFASLDHSGVMTVDKPPLALWVQSLSVRVFGYHPLSMLVPQALMGVASVLLVYDLVRRRFGRIGGFVAGLALATTPITVGISRHNNPDALLVLCCVAALWFAVRALEDRRTRWLVLAGVCVGLGFETKMGVALAVVPGIAAAWLWTARRGRAWFRALGQLLAGGAAMVLVGGAWPALVELTPAADRPWVSGTSDNRILSLIFEYNGLGRVDGQTGGPGGGGGNMFGGSPGPLRLLNSALGGQAGWLLGFALVSGLGILVASRLRRSDARSGWLLAVGGAFLTTAVLFSAASGIFHPYYVSLLAPFAAALVGAGAAQLLGGGLNARILGPLAIGAGVASELIVRGQYPGQLSWLPAVLIIVGALAALAPAVFSSPRVRMLAVGAVLAALLAAPSVWAFDTLGYATNGTFPSGGPASALSAGGGGPFGGFGGARGARSLKAGRGVQLFGPGGGTGAGGASAGGAPGAGVVPGAGAPVGAPPPLAGGAPSGAPAGFAGGTRGAAGGPGFAGGGGGAFGAPIGNSASIAKALSYVKAHGGGTVAVSSQSSASQAIIDQNANVAGIGGFSGRESDVSVSWLAQEVRDGKIRWVLSEQGGASGGGPRLAGDTRAGSKAAMATVAKVCEPVSLATVTGTGGTSETASATGASGGRGGSSEGSLYDCQGRAAALLRSGARQSTS